ncbi:MAG: ArsR/SmtB family transcription factor [Dermatophilaceae bacterium]
MSTPAVIDSSDLDVCCDGTTSQLMPADQAAELSAVFKALADPTRIRLLQYLARSGGGTVCACHLPAALGISQPTLSFHMKKLHEGGLVHRHRHGRWVHYTVRSETLRAARGLLHMAEPDLTAGEPVADLLGV